MWKKLFSGILNILLMNSYVYHSRIHKPARIQICRIHLCLQIYSHSNDVWFLDVLKYGMFDTFTPNNLFLILGMNTSYIYYVKVLRHTILIFNSFIKI